MNLLRWTDWWLSSLAHVATIARGCGSNNGSRPADGGVGTPGDGGRLPPKSIIYTTPGCGAEAIPRCEAPDGDGCSMFVCICDGVNSSGNGCGFSQERFFHVGWCKQYAAVTLDVSIGADQSENQSNDSSPNADTGF